MSTATPEFLTGEDLLAIHEALVAEFARTGDPISPPGVKHLNLLESAVHRQHVGHSGKLKYADALSSAATLTFGICCNHPFHNGNKRTALVAMLVHLDKNKRTIHGADQRALYELMISIADHTVGEKKSARHHDRRHPDEEVQAIAHWMRRHTRVLDRSERQIPFRRLRECLARFGFELHPISGNKAEVGKHVERKTGVLRRRLERVWDRISVIGYRDEGTEVSVSDLKSLRRACGLTEENGIDSETFYSQAAIVDSFVNRHRTLLRRLGKT